MSTEHDQDSPKPPTTEAEQELQEPEQLNAFKLLSGQVTTIDLLRHGEVDSQSMFSAPEEASLSMTGWKQLTVATQTIAWDAVISSPLRRCHDFARLLAQRLDSPFVMDERLAELDFGAWIGKSEAQIQADDAELLHQFFHQPRRFIAPEGESMENFTQRVTAAWDELQQAYSGQHVLVITHTAVIRLILSRSLDILYQKSQHFDVDFASFTRLRLYPDGEVSLLGHGLPQVETI